MTMDPTAFHVVYVDHRAKLDRVECRGSSSFRLSLQPTETNQTSDDDNEHDGLQQNLEALLSAFSTGIELRGPARLSHLLRAHANFLPRQCRFAPQRNPAYNIFPGSIVAILVQCWCFSISPHDLVPTKKPAFTTDDTIRALPLDLLI